MICAKRVLPRFTRYSGSKARSVHESQSAVQIGDTPNRAASPMNRGIQLGTCCFNRTAVLVEALAPNKWRIQAKADATNAITFTVSYAAFRRGRLWV